MLRDLFESFYEGNINKSATQIVANNDGFSYIKNLDGVYEEYLNQKTALRCLIKSSTDNSARKDSDLLDGHKVSACITCTYLHLSCRIENRRQSTASPSPMRAMTVFRTLS